MVSWSEVTKVQLWTWIKVWEAAWVLHDLDKEWSDWQGWEAGFIFKGFADLATPGLKQHSIINTFAGKILSMYFQEKHPSLFWYKQYIVIYCSHLNLILSRRLYELFHCSCAGKLSSRDCCANEVLKSVMLMTAELLLRLEKGVKLFTLREEPQRNTVCFLKWISAGEQRTSAVYSEVIYISLKQSLKIYTVFVSFVSVFFFLKHVKNVFFFFFFTRIKARTFLCA